MFSLLSGAGEPAYKPELALRAGGAVRDHIGAHVRLPLVVNDDRDPAPSVVGAAGTFLAAQDQHVVS
jgi:hypothetical protein